VTVSSVSSARVVAMIYWINTPVSDKRYSMRYDILEALELTEGNGSDFAGEY